MRTFYKVVEVLFHATLWTACISLSSSGITAAIIAMDILPGEIWFIAFIILGFTALLIKPEHKPLLASMFCATSAGMIYIIIIFCPETLPLGMRILPQWGAGIFVATGLVLSILFAARQGFEKILKSIS